MGGRGLLTIFHLSELNITVDGNKCLIYYLWRSDCPLTIPRPRASRNKILVQNNKLPSIHTSIKYWAIYFGQYDTSSFNSSNIAHSLGITTATVSEARHRSASSPKQFVINPLPPAPRSLPINVIFPSGKLNINPGRPWTGSSRSSRYGHVSIAPRAVIVGWTAYSTLGTTVPNFMTTASFLDGWWWRRNFANGPRTPRRKIDSENGLRRFGSPA